LTAQTITIFYANVYFTYVDNVVDKGRYCHVLCSQQRTIGYLLLLHLAFAMSVYSFPIYISAYILCLQKYFLVHRYVVTIMNREIQ
jgi:hypothetical protein